jgi:hypothetical protein
MAHDLTGPNGVVGYNPLPWLPSQFGHRCIAGRQVAEVAGMGPIGSLGVANERLASGGPHGETATSVFAFPSNSAIPNQTSADIAFHGTCGRPANPNSLTDGLSLNLPRWFATLTRPRASGASTCVPFPCCDLAYAYYSTSALARHVW